MNKLVLNLFSVLFPFYPLWAWFCIRFVKKPIEFFIGIILFPIAIYFLIYVNKKLPKYLIFLNLFTAYHILSAFINHTIPVGANKFYFILTDPNVIACLFFVIIEYSFFTNKFIGSMNKNILFIVLISLIVSLVQVKNPEFFFNAGVDEDLLYVGESRNFSIYSWVSLNSTGVTFPILISILVSAYQTRNSILPIVILSGIVVSFLTRARYVMISALIVISQIFFNTKRSFSKRVSIAIAFAGGILVVVLIAMNLGFDFEEIINTRILEKESDMASAKARFLSYEVFMIVFQENPWFGVGPETKKDVIDMLQGEAPLIHVGYLSYLYFYGIVGCSLLFFGLFFLLREMWVIGRRNNFWGSFYGIASFCLANTTFVYFNLSEMGIILSVIYMKYHKNNALSSGDREGIKLPVVIKQESVIIT